MRIFDEQRRELARLCEALGVDPGQVLDIQWHRARPKSVKLTILDDPVTHARHEEDYPIPEGWDPAVHDTGVIRR